MVFGPVGMVDGTEEWLLVGIEDLGAIVRGVGYGLNGSGMESDRRAS